MAGGSGPATATARGAGEAEGKQPEERGPAPEIVAIGAIERVDVAPRILRRGVALGASGPAAALAAPAHRRFVALEAEAMSEQAAGDDAQGRAALARASADEQRAHAVELEIEAAESRLSADELRRERAALASAGNGASRESERDARIARRIAGRDDGERRGLRRLRPRPGSSFYSPAMVGTAGTASRYAAMAERDLDREIEAIRTVLRERGPLARDELERGVRERGWGPGRFAAALREALREGRARRGEDKSYGPA